MRELDTLIGKVVTVKSATGLEFLGSLTEVNAESGFISISEPRAINLTQDQMIQILPYTLTGQASLVGINLSSILTVVESLEETAEDYKNMIISENSSRLQEERDSKLVEA